jgi:hypothetical protein
MTFRSSGLILPAIAIPLASVAGLVAILAGGGLDASAASGLNAASLCATSGPIGGLQADAAQNARVVAAAAMARGGSKAALISLMAGLAESELRILGNPNDQTGLASPVQGVGFDHDSLGIFQQRPSWGSVQQRLDPIASTNLLLDRLLVLPDWRSINPWQAAQKVQQSAFNGVPRPENRFSSVYGGNYRAQLTTATRILAGIEADSADLNCSGSGGAGNGQPPSGPIVLNGLPTDFAIPTSSPPARQAVLAALAELGKPYVFGTAGPATFDCSGLTQWAWARAGIDLPHYTGDQWLAGTATEAARLLPGDLVLTPGADGTLADPQHVGMYIGQGLVVEAPQTGDVVKVVSYSSFVSAGLSGLRHIA